MTRDCAQGRSLRWDRGAIFGMQGGTTMEKLGRAALVAAAVTISFGLADDELGACDGCGSSLSARVITFARCGCCGAENYRPPADHEPPERKVARFWARATRPSLAPEMRPG